MTIQAQLPDSPQSQESPSPTLRIELAQPSHQVASRLLDHRTRAGALPHSVAPPGRYLAVAGDRAPLLVALDRPITHIGRGPLADLRLEDPHVSRRHAIIAQRAGSARVLDDRSANGTFVNDGRVTVADLHDGDVVRFGAVTMRYVEIPWERPGGRSDSETLRFSRHPAGRLSGQTPPGQAA